MIRTIMGSRIGVAILCGMIFGAVHVTWAVNDIGDPKISNKNVAADLKPVSQVKVNSANGLIVAEAYYEPMPFTQPDGASGMAPMFWLYVPDTGNIWYEGAIKGLEQEWLSDCDRLWLLPKVGIVSVVAQDQSICLDVCKVVVKNAKAGRETVLRNAANCFESITRPRTCRQIHQIGLEPYLGVEFLRRKDDAMPPRPAKIRTVTFVKKMWTIEIVSHVSGELAVVVLDEDFNLIKVIRGNKQVYSQTKEPAATTGK